MIELGNVMILGDSYSTFEGYNPEGYDVWYNREKKDYNDVACVEDCWWYQFFREISGKLVLNCSYSGTTICNTGYNGADCREISFIGRLDKLIEKGYFKENKIDTLIIFGATNDSWAGSPLGSPMYEGFGEESLRCVYPAFSYMLSRAKEVLPSARIIYILNYYLNPEFSATFKEACEHFKVEFLPLAEFQAGGGHPTVLGMKQIKEQVLEYLERN